MYQKKQMFCQRKLKKKREALIQIGPLQKHCDNLEKRIYELESENSILKNIIGDLVKNNGQNKIEEIIEPIDKIISNSMKEKNKYFNFQEDNQIYINKKIKQI
ncbi:hypothetical protein IMG5_019020 [Ichthyophthirius multifiliis]|uniref:BZIP domain-containing protein n=1 Tax=Ichthyophthirius multifiliis TaxID=5932 RepID=G0QKK4_ICHMU|nr:hypothetical protein IMG5_019020 [Ichthyophthirius multifiliis]EGR34255.1 hypothetical protein IMG5_019020 [Ichthyophthirius multifiliis]|eukprot:XP_004039559.1 hypothetical protein IMG5_019020 [Ichthyophthirius multifiliis]